MQQKASGPINYLDANGFCRHDARPRLTRAEESAADGIEQTASGVVESSTRHVLRTRRGGEFNQLRGVLR